jgi:Protein of unknown function (DUF3592)
MRSSKLVFFLVGGIFLLVGIPFLIVAFFTYQSTTNFLRGALTSTGTITRCNWVTSTTTTRDSNGNTHTSTSTLCQPTVRFRTQDERTIVFVSNVSNSSMREGQQVQVSYHADQPENARLSSFGDLWVLPLVFGGLGSVFTLVGLLLFFALRPLLALLFIRSVPTTSYMGTSSTDSPYTDYAYTNSPYATNFSSTSFSPTNDQETMNEDEDDLFADGEDEEQDGREQQDALANEERFPSDNPHTYNKDTF